MFRWQPIRYIQSCHHLCPGPDASVKGMKHQALDVIYLHGNYELSTLQFFFEDPNKYLRVFTLICKKDQGRPSWICK